MLRLYDFKCLECQEVKEELVESGIKTIDCECGGKRYITITAPNIHGCDSFNPHYDLQLGQHFKTKEDKEKFLKDTGRVQVSGQASPRKSNNTSIICNRKQAAKEFGIEKPKKAWAPTVS